MRTAHDIIGSFRWDNNHLGGIGGWVSPPFLLGSWKLLGTSSVVTGRDDMLLTSMGVIDEAITTCFDCLLKAVSLPALQYTLLNQRVSTS
jgi:hypothetical protein